MKRFAGLAWSLFWLLPAAFFCVCFYDRYWRWRDCFNDLGRCYDPVDQMVYLEQAGIIWAGLAAMCLLAALLGLIVAFWRQRRPIP